MVFKNRFIFQIAVLLMVAIVFTGCYRKLGYFVVTWPEDGSSFQLGEIYTVRGESNLRHVYILELEKKKFLEIPKFRGYFSSKLQDAKSYREAYLPYKDLFAYVNKKFPMRESPDVQSGRAYMLREGDILKIISRSDEKVKLSPVLEGYWYQAVTGDGVMGYCFDKNLVVFNNLENSASDYITTNDVNFENFLNTEWFPVEMKENLDGNYPDVQLLRSGQMVFADSAKKEISIRTKDRELIFKYNSVQQIAEDKVLFNGTPLELTSYPEGKIFLRYSYKGEDFSGFYTVLDKPVAEYIAEINERKKKEFQDMLDGNILFASENHGTIRFSEDQRFTWDGYDGTGYIIPGSSGISGFVSNDYYVSNVLKKKFGYRGVMTFTFTRNGKDVNFICNRTKTGEMQLIYLPKESLLTGIVTKLPEDPVMVVFHPVKDNE